MKKKPKILIVEDEIKFAKMIKMRLEHEGYKAIIARDAYEGTTLVVKDHPDLVVLDLMMPAGGGMKVLERIRDHRDIGDIPVIVVTGKTLDNDLKEQIDALGVQSIFNKPLDDKVFLSVIRENFGEKTHHAHS